MARAGHIHLGPFTLERPLGRGGAGQVWLGTSRATGERVAVKVVRPILAGNARFLHHFQTEVQAMAALEHPGVVRVLDYGRVSEEQASASGGPLRAGAPYFAMEYASGGSLRDLYPITNYETAKRILLQLLQALAHAHARGVIHRDIKPTNILVRRPGPVPEVLLGDFGIAAATRRGRLQGTTPAETTRLRLWAGQPTDSFSPTEADRVLAVGTPAYMAPEQIYADEQNLGPWTDLYALGCLAYEMFTGHPPFSHPKAPPKEVMRAHLYDAPPPPRWRFAVPDGTEEWLSHLLAKVPWERFQRAADAARFLESLGSPTSSWRPAEESVDPTPPEESSRQTDLETMPPTPLMIPAWPGEADLPAGRPGTTQQGLGPIPANRGTSPSPARRIRPVRLEAFPDTWRDPTPAERRLAPPSLSLFGLRPVPFVGRERERDTLWALLRRCYETQRPHVACLSGAAGFGKSRLASWLCERADELGWAEVLAATHGPFPAPTHGLAHALAVAMRCVGMSRSSIWYQILHVISPLAQGLAPEVLEPERLATALTEIVWPSTQSMFRSGRADSGSFFAGKGERYAAIQDFFFLKSKDRPVVLCLEDVHWSAEALDLALFLLASHRPLPVLVLLTYRPEDMRERPVEQKLLEDLLDRERVERLDLPPLSDAEMGALLDALLPLEDSSRTQVVSRSGGNPLLAVQLLHDWVQRSLLEANGSRFRLAPGAETALPEDLHALWTCRLERLAAQLGREILTPLSVAAALGIEVNESIWSQVCERLGQPAPEGLVEALVESRLARRVPEGWAFAHGLMRESIERAAREAGQWKAIHLACAQVIQESDEPGRWTEPLAHHLLEAEELEAAAEALLQAAYARYHTGAYERARQLLDEREEALSRLPGHPVGSAPYLEGWLLEATVAFEQADFERAEALLGRVEEYATGVGLFEYRASMLKLRARIHRMRGRLPEALAAAQEAAAVYERLEMASEAASCNLLVARLHFESTGRLRTALETAERAVALFQQRGDEANLAEGHYVLALLEQALGDRRRADQRALEARKLYRKIGNRFGEAACENFLGETARQSESFAAARRHYRRAIEILDSLGSNWTYVLRINLCLVLVQSGRFQEAEPLLRAIREDDFEGKDAVLCYTSYALLACSAASGRWTEFRVWHEEAAQVVPGSGRVDRDLAILARIAAEQARRQGRPDLGAMAYRLARDHFAALEDADALRDVERGLRECLSVQ